MSAQGNGQVLYPLCLSVSNHDITNIVAEFISATVETRQKLSSDLT